MVEIEYFIRENKHVTGAKLAIHFGEDPEGSITCAENLVIVPGVSSEVAEALMSLASEGKVFWSPISQVAYYLEGVFVSLPVTYVQKPYDTLHWLPAAFNALPAHRRVVEAIRRMGCVGFFPKNIDLDRACKLQTEHSSLGCQMCGNCCLRANPISLEPHDIERLADYFGISVKKTLKRYAVLVEKDGFRSWAMKTSQPCEFYDKKTHLCKIHPARPMICRTFPQLSFAVLSGDLGPERLTWCPLVTAMADFLDEK